MNEDKNRQICSFRIREGLFGVDIRDVKEIHPPTRFTPVFHAGKEVRGFVNIRGQVHLIIDLRVLLGFEGKEPDELSQMILFKPHVGESFGVLVDCIGDVVRVDAIRTETVGEKDKSSGAGHFSSVSKLLSGICKLDTELLMILNSALLLKQIGRNLPEKGM